MASNRVIARWISHRIWIAGKKPLVKRAPATGQEDNFDCVNIMHPQASVIFNIL